MSDHIDELERNVEPHVEWLCQRLNVEGNGYEGGPDDRALLEVRMTVRQLATIAREAESRALTWQLTTENTQKLLNEATARAIEKEQKYREADERAWACESVGIPGLEARALKAEAMCEWLAERLEESDDTVLAADTWLVAAREAVANER